jgi:hypothetical protein
MVYNKNETDNSIDDYALTQLATGFVDSKPMLHQSSLNYICHPNSSGEMSYDVYSEFSPSKRPLSSRRLIREEIKPIIRHDLSHDGKVQNISCSPLTPPPRSDDLPSVISTQRIVRFQIPVDRAYSISDNADNDMTDDCCESHEVIDYRCDLFWTRNDLLNCRKRAQLKANFIRSKFPMEVEALEDVMCNCIDTKNCQINDSDSLIIGNVEASLKKLENYRKDSAAMYNWCSSYVRGLEVYMTPMMISERHQAIRHFLSYQAYLRNENFPSASIEEDLCKRSQILSHRAREFAFKIAIGDALTASHNR